MRVEQVMTRKVATCRSEDSGQMAARIMWENDCGCVPVVEGSSVIGMITDRDLCMAVYFQGKPLEQLPVAAVMSREIAACKPGDSIEDAEQTMASSQVRRLPVLDAQGRLVGILSLNDIAREAARERSRVGREVTDAEVGETLSVVSQPHAGRQAAAS